MRVSFKAHFYKMSPFFPSEVRIKTDNEKKLGEKPVLKAVYPSNEILDRKFSKNENSLPYVDISWRTEWGPLKYKINYQDTGKTDDKEGDYYKIDVAKLDKKTLDFNHQAMNLKKVLTLSRGKITGKLVTPKNNEDLNKIADDSHTPYILLISDFNHITPDKAPKNTIGLVSLGANFGILSHQSAIWKSKTEASVFITDESMFQDVQKHLGRYVELETRKDSFNIKEVDKSEVKFNPKIQKINIPELTPVDKLLASSEYTPHTVGAKAMNLARLENLHKKGKIDVTIPKSFAIPHAYLEKMGEEKTKWQTEIKSMIEQTGIEGENVMVRSAFNGEDLDNYSAAGLYDSFESRNDIGRIYMNINRVAESKWNKRAVSSREEYNIPHENVKPTVLIQQHEPCDYVFTLYTNDEDNNMRIEMFSKYTKQHRFFKYPVSPNVFIVNGITGKITTEQKENVSKQVTFDEDLNIVDVEKIENPIFDNFEKFKPVLERIVKNAYAVEREFGKPQDIEGGIRFGDDRHFEDEKVFFWQTRNIVG